MKLTIDFQVPDSKWKVEPQDEIISLGSCFSEEIGQRLKQDGFTVETNPFGVIFHPIPLAVLLHKSIHVKTDTRIIRREDVSFSWNASGTFFAYDTDTLLKQFNTTILMLHAKLKLAKVLIVTFGTAFGYRHKDFNEIVANCHKQSGDNFEKELSEVDEMKRIWSDLIPHLKKFNPSLKIIFTVSPVKHLKDGVVENLRSKSRLIELVHQLEGDYFSSYEIVQEELRDYRFYKTDGAHPNELAINEVYERFIETYFSDYSKTFQQDVSKYNTMKNHRLIYTKSEQSAIFQKKIEIAYQELITKYSFLTKKK